MSKTYIQHYAASVVGGCSGPSDALAGTASPLRLPPGRASMSESSVANTIALGVCAGLKYEGVLGDLSGELVSQVAAEELRSLCSNTALKFEAGVRTQSDWSSRYLISKSKSSSPWVSCCGWALFESAASSAECPRRGRESTAK